MRFERDRVPYVIRFVGRLGRIIETQASEEGIGTAFLIQRQSLSNGLCTGAESFMTPHELLPRGNGERIS